MSSVLALLREEFISKHHFDGAIEADLGTIL
jgi:hypothetical protein